MPFFITSAVDEKNFPDHNLWEFSLVGKSNSGKSSLINALANKKIAKTSKEAGKTKTLNFYDFEKFWLVDLPGYGYVEKSLSLKNILEGILNQYFLHREKIYGVLHISAIENFSEYDLLIKEYLINRFDNYLLVLNKIDRLSKLQQKKYLIEISKKSNLDSSKILLVSAKKRINISKLLKYLLEWAR